MRRSPLRVLLPLLLLVGTLAPPAQARPLAQGSTATLTIIAGQVEAQAPGAGSFAPAGDGQTVAIGARVRTGADSRAVLTFFDGTTATLDPNTEITLDRVQASAEQPGGLVVGVGLTVGRVWTQVTSLFDRGSSFEVNAASATALAREGATGYRKDPDGTLICWAIAGKPLRVRTGEGEIELLAGQQVTLPPGQGLAPVIPRNFGPGLLEVRTEGSALARVVNPVNLTVGFPLEDLVVNQVVDATTSLPGESNHWIQIPGPAPGPYQLVVHSLDGGPYRVRVMLALEERELFSLEWSNNGRVGEQLIGEVIVDASGGRPSGAQLGALRPLVGQPPGKFVYP